MKERILNRVRSIQTWIKKIAEKRLDVSITDVGSAFPEHYRQAD